MCLRLPVNWTGGVAYDSGTRVYIVNDHRSHPNYCARPDTQWPVGRSWMDQGANTNEYMVTNDHISATLDSRGKSDEIADYAIMRHIGAEVQVEVAANGCIG